MATFTIREGKHYHVWPPISTLPWIGSQYMEREVVFEPSCEYDSAAYNADDVNKLFGLSFGFGGVHDNSARFGWRWSKSQQCIELLAYVYNEGVLNWDEQQRFPVVAQVEIGEPVTCSIQRITGSYGLYLFCVEGPQQPMVRVTVPAPTSLPSFGLTHGCFFGGVLTAPHEMKVQINRT